MKGNKKKIKKFNIWPTFKGANINKQIFLQPLKQKKNPCDSAQNAQITRV